VSLEKLPLDLQSFTEWVNRPALEARISSLTGRRLAEPLTSDARSSLRMLHADTLRKVALDYMLTRASPRTDAVYSRPGSSGSGSQEATPVQGVPQLATLRTPPTTRIEQMADLLGNNPAQVNPESDSGRIGRGTYGSVFVAEDTEKAAQSFARKAKKRIALTLQKFGLEQQPPQQNEEPASPSTPLVALKLLTGSGSREGLPRTAIREAKILRWLGQGILRSELVQLLDVVLAYSVHVSHVFERTAVVQSLAETEKQSAMSDDSTSIQQLVARYSQEMENRALAAAEVAKAVREELLTMHFVFEFCEHDLLGLLSVAQSDPYPRMPSSSPTLQSFLVSNPICSMYPSLIECKDRTRDQMELLKVRPLSSSIALVPKLPSKHPMPLDATQIKHYMRGVLLALETMHSYGLLHRDIKAANVLVSNRCGAVLTDLGLSRGVDEVSKRLGLTNRVVTLYYRPPELLLGATRYDDKVDIWGVGCIFAELLLGGRRAFRGASTDLEQLASIFAVTGPPTADRHARRSATINTAWPDLIHIRGHPLNLNLRRQQQQQPSTTASGMHTLFSIRTPDGHPSQSDNTQVVSPLDPWPLSSASLSRMGHGLDASEFPVEITAACFDLLTKMLALDPANRPSATECLNHPYFTSEYPPLLTDEQYAEKYGTLYGTERYHEMRWKHLRKPQNRQEAQMQ